MKRVYRNYNIDALRTILALLVVFIHFPVSYDVWINPLSRCTIPSFYIISGYFISWDKDQDKGVKKAIKIVFLMTIVWGLIYWIYDNLFIDNIRHVIFYTPQELIELFLFNRIAHGFHLWYLAAYLYALFLSFFYLHFNLLRWRYVTICFLLLVNLLFSNYSELLFRSDFPFFYTRNGILWAFPLLLIGGCLRCDINVENLKKYGFVFLLVFVAIYIGCIVETALWGDVYYITNGTFGSIVASVALLLFVFSLGNGKETMLSRIGRKYSLYIYLLHPMFLPLLPFFHREIPVLDAVLPIIIFMISLALATLIVSLKNLNHEKKTC